MKPDKLKPVKSKAKPVDLEVERLAKKLFAVCLPVEAMFRHLEAADFATWENAHQHIRNIMMAQARYVLRLLARERKNERKRIADAEAEEMRKFQKGFAYQPREVRK